MKFTAYLATYQKNKKKINGIPKSDSKEERKTSIGLYKRFTSEVVNVKDANGGLKPTSCSKD